MNQIFEWFMNNPWATALLMVVFIGISTLMVLAILIQRPQGGGLSAAFGGGSAGSGQTAFGTKTGDALTWFTISVFAAFLLFGIILNYATTPVKLTPGAVTEAAATQQAPAESGAPGAQTPPITPPAATPAPAAPASETPPAPSGAAPAGSGASPAPVSSPSPAPSTTPAPVQPAPKN